MRDDELDWATRVVSALLLGVALCLLLAGCTGITVGEVGLGQDVTKYAPWTDGQGGGWKGDGPVVTFRVRRISEDGVRYCEVAHTSNLASGWPFNDREETYLDAVSCGLRINLSEVADSIWEHSQ
jgi:hypothetical protein